LDTVDKSNEHASLNVNEDRYVEVIRIVGESGDTVFAILWVSTSLEASLPGPAEATWCLQR